MLELIKKCHFIYCPATVYNHQTQTKEFHVVTCQLYVDLLLCKSGTKSIFYSSSCEKAIGCVNEGWQERYFHKSYDRAMRSRVQTVSFIAS